MMTLTKALKVKNRLAGKLADLQNRANKFNVTDSLQEKYRTTDMVKLWQDIESTRDKLIEIKGKISEATAPISAKLQEMTEYKSYLKFLTLLTISEGQTTEPYGYNSSVPFQPSVIKSYIDEASRSKQVSEFQEKIESLQDDIDIFNASKQINFS